MAIVELKVPSPGESITEVIIARWVRNTGDVVEKDEVLAEIDSDKATLTLNAEEAGKIEVLAAEGDTVKVGQVVVKIDTSVKPEAKKEAPKAEAKAEPKKEEPKPAKQEAATAATATYASGTPSPAAAKLMAENNISGGQLNGTGKDGRITKADAMAAELKLTSNESKSRNDRAEKMTSLRKTVAKRLVAVKNETAMLTTFNEVDMKPIMDLRNQYKNQFKENISSI